MPLDMKLDTTSSPGVVLQLAMYDPYVSRAVNLWRAGELTWELALQAAVVALAAERARLVGELVELRKMERHS